MTWKDVNLEHGTITVRSKGGKLNHIPLTEELSAHLCTLDRRTPWLYPNGSGHIKDVKTAWRTALRRAGITDFHFHDLRHTFASHFIMNTGDLRTLQELLGHADMQMTKRYSHLSDEYKRLAMSRLPDMDTPPARQRLGKDRTHTQTRASSANTRIKKKSKKGGRA